MKSKYTPGEWKTSGRQIFTFDESKGEEFIDREIIANIYEINKNKEEVEANAKLIAAAPEMLEALILLTEMNNKYKTVNEFKDDELAAHRKAILLIKKATE